MAFFIGIACPWLVVAALEILSRRRHDELVAGGHLTVNRAAHSAYLTSAEV